MKNTTPRPWKICDWSPINIMSDKGQYGDECVCTVHDPKNRELIIAAVNQFDSLQAENATLKERIEALLDNHGITKAKIEVIAMEAENKRLRDELERVNQMLESLGIQSNISALKKQ